LRNRTPLKLEPIKAPYDVRPKNIFSNENFAELPHVRILNFIPRPAVAVLCLRCQYKAHSEVLLYTREEVDEHIQMHNLLDTE
jgi:hypothetical protein